MSQSPAAPSRLVTPEAVELQFETAGLGSRSVAILLDLVIQGVVLVLLNIAVAVFLLEGSGLAGMVVALVLSALVLLGYPAVWETLWRGRTPGKAAMGLRVVTRDGAPVQFRHAAVRSFLMLVDLWMTSGFAAVVSILLSRDEQRLGDLAAGTVVLRERSGAGAPSAVRFDPPPGWEGYAASLDTAGLTPDDYGAVRSFLLRVHSLSRDVGEPLAWQLATTVAQRLGHQPPPQIGPDAYLACVAAAHQRRGEGAGLASGGVPGVTPSSSPAATDATGSTAWAPAAGVWAETTRPVVSDRPDSGAPQSAPARSGGDGGFAPPG